MAGDAKVSQNTWVPMAGDARGRPGAVQTGVLTAHPESAQNGPFAGQNPCLGGSRGVPPMTDLSGRESVAKHVGPYGWEVLLAIYVVRGCF